MGNRHVKSQPVRPTRPTTLTSSSKYPLKIQEYSILDNLGVGGQGQVFKAQKCEKEYALKRIRTNKNADFLKKLKEQVKYMRLLSSQHILPVKEQFKYVDQLNQEEYYCIVTQKCESNLLDILYEDLNQSQKMDISKQLITAVAWMHEQKIVHRDLKPENILYNEGKIKICDFGLSKIIKDYLHSDVGTELYKPYQILCGKQYTQKADMWSLGLVLIELWVGKRIVTQNLNNKRNIVFNNEFPWNQKLIYITNDNLRFVVSKMVQKYEKDRITARQALRNLNLCLIQEREDHKLVKDQFYNGINDQLRKCSDDLTHLIIRQGKHEQRQYK